jgi:hypothetical protein
MGLTESHVLYKGIIPVMLLSTDLNSRRHGWDPKALSPQGFSPHVWSVLKVQDHVPAFGR